MKVKELIKELEKHDCEKEAVIFAKGSGYPILGVQDLTEKFGLYKVEIGGGWNEIEEEASDENGNRVGKAYPL